MHQLLKKTFKTAALLGAMTLVGAAQATSAFEGRAANGAVDLSCTAHGDASTYTPRCAMYYYRALDITILNNWNIGGGTWNNAATFGSAQAVVEFAGYNATGLHGWVLPTGDRNLPAGSGNQFKAIWESAGSSLDSLSAQFDGVQPLYYWSGTEYDANFVWAFGTYSGSQDTGGKHHVLSAVAVRPGDVTAAVPEPETYALMLLGLGAVLVARGRRAL